MTILRHIADAAHRLIDTARIVGWFEMAAAPFVEFRRLALDLSKHRGMIEGD